MNDAVILAINTKYIHSSLAPWYLKAAVQDILPGCAVVEHTINEKISDVLDDIIARSPRLVGISVYIWNISFATELAKMIKSRLPETKILFGGPEVSYNPRSVLENCDAVDYIISGEGEVPFYNLCRSIFFGDDQVSDGISYRCENRLEIAEPYIGTYTPRSPYINEYFAALRGRISYFESSRGCPYSCAYCLSGRCEKMRFFDMDYVYKNLVLLANSGTKTVKFVDRTFNADKKRAVEIFRFIIEKSGVDFPRDVCFHFELSGDLLDDETINYISSAPKGLFQFEIGIQTINPKTIEAIRRKSSTEVLVKRIGQLVDMRRAHIHIDLIAGLPYEGYESFCDSFDSAYVLGADMLQLGFLKILHGTELEARAIEYGLCSSDVPPYEVYKTKWLSEDDISKLKITEDALDRLYNSGRFTRTLRLCVALYERPYDFFYEIGRILPVGGTLDEMTNAFYKYITDKFTMQKNSIRDAMICDRFAVNSSKTLPSSLYAKNPLLKKVRTFLNTNPLTAEKDGVRRNIAVICDGEKAVYADYGMADFDWREYNLHYISMTEVRKYEKN